MVFKDWLVGRAFLAALIVFLFLTSCVDTLESEQVIYDNDFSDLDLAGFENARLFIFQKDTVVGFYHNEEIAVNLDNLPNHNLLKITLDILIHDSWDGNPVDGVGGADFWFFGVDNQEVFRTTFSNTPCVSTYCLRQSYPSTYFRQNAPKTGATSTNMPGRCLFDGTEGYTTRYSISQIVEHTNSKVRIHMNSELVQTNSPNPICDESWSLASVKVEALTLK
jgi:hypothetical protein